MMKRNNWTREETIVAFNVYCKIPFKDSRASHPEIIKYANIIGRSPSALNMKIGNFGRLDPELKEQGITGLSNGGKLEQVIWDEFNGNWDDLAFESEKLIFQFQNKEIADLTTEGFLEGKERETTVKTRVNQSFFRSTVLSSYNSSCCITGLSIPELLVASHIVPWSVDEKNRINPHNGLCLNSIHDKAFDRGFITLTSDFKVLISNEIYEYETNNSINDFFFKYRNQKIALPDKFLPSQEFLQFHREVVFRK